MAEGGILETGGGSGDGEIGGAAVVEVVEGGFWKLSPMFGSLWEIFFIPFLDESGNSKHLNFFPKFF